MLKNHLLAFFLLIVFSMPTFADKATEKVSAFLEKGEITLAIKEAETLAKRKPTNYQYLYQLIALKHTQQEYAEVIDLCTKLDKLKSRKPEIKAKAKEKQPEFAYSGEVMRDDALRGVRFISNAPTYYQHVYYSGRTQRIIKASLASFNQIYTNNKVSNIHILQPTTLQQAKNLSYQHLVILYKTIDKATMIPQHEKWRKKIRAISATEYLILYDLSITENIDLTDSLKKQSVFSSTPEKKLTTLLLIDSSRLNDKLLSEAITLSAKQLPFEHIRFRIQLLLRQGKPEEVFMLLENSKLNLEAQSLLLLEQANHLPRKQLTTALLKYHRLNKDKQSLTRRKIESKWIEMNKNTEVKDILTDIHFILKEGNKTPFKNHDTARFRDYHHDKNWLVFLLPSLPDSIFRYISSRAPEALKNLLPHFHEIESAPLRVSLLFHLGEQKKAELLLQKEIKLAPESLDLRFIAISQIHSHAANRDESTISSLPHLEAIYANKLSAPVRAMVDQFALELLRNIYSSKALKKQFKPKAYLQEVLRRTQKSSDSPRNSRLYSMLDMEREYLKLEEKFELEKKRLALAQEKVKRDITKAFIQNLQKGNQELALETAATDIKNQLQLHRNYQSIKLYKEAKKKELHLKLTKLLTPQNSDAIYPWIKFHNFMEECGDLDGTQLTISHLQKSKFIPLQYRVHVAMILMPDFTEQALKILKSLPDDMHPSVSKAFGKCYRKKSLLGQRRLQHLKGFLRYLEYFYENKSHILRNMRFNNEFYILSRFAEPEAPAYISSNKKKAPTEYSRERDEVINAIAKELMYYPHMASQMFQIYIQKNNPTDQEIMKLSAMILRQKTLQLEAKNHSDSLSANHYPRKLKTPYDYLVHYLISQPEKAKQIYGNQLIDFLKSKHRSNEYEQTIPFVIGLSREQDASRISKIVQQRLIANDFNELLFASHYNPLILPELTRLYFKHIDQFTKSVEKQVAEVAFKDKKPSDLRIDKKTLSTLERVTPIVSAYLNISKKQELWLGSIRRLFNADPLTIHPLTDFTNNKAENDILRILKMIIRIRSGHNTHFLLNLTKDYPGLFPLVEFDSNVPPHQTLDRFKDLKLLCKSTELDFNILTPDQHRLWEKYLSQPSKRRSRNTTKAQRSLYLYLANQHSHRLNTNMAEFSKIPELASSLFCFKACTLPDYSKRLLDYLQKNSDSFHQLSKKQKADLIYVLGLDSRHSSDLAKRPKLMKKLGISPTQLAQKHINDAMQFLAIKNIDDLQFLRVSEKSKHLLKNLAHIDPALAAKVALKQIDLFCESKKAIKRYPDLKIRTQKAYDNFIPYRDAPQNFIQSMIFNVELLTHPKSHYLKKLNSIHFFESRKHLDKHTTRNGVNDVYKDHITYFKKLITEFDKIPGKQRQDNLRLLLIRCCCRDNYICNLLLSTLKEIRQTDPAFLSKHQELLDFIDQACQYADNVYDHKISPQPYSISHLRSKPPLTLDLSNDLKKPTPLKLLDELSNKELHLALINTIYLAKYKRNKLLITISIDLLERLKDPNQALDYDDLLKQLANEHQSNPNQQLVFLARNLLLQIDYLKSFSVRQSFSYQHLSYIATNGKSTNENIAFTKLLLEKTPVLKEQLYYQLKSIMYDLPVSHPIDFSKYHPDRTSLQFDYTKKLEDAFAKIDQSKLTKKELFYFYRATAYLRDAPSDLHLIHSNHQARINRLAEIIPLKYIAYNYTVSKHSIKYLSDNASIDTARALLPYFNENLGQNKLFDKATFSSSQRDATTLYYALAIYDLKLKELNSCIDRLYPAKPHYSVYGDYSKALVNGATIAALECIHTNDHKRLAKLLPTLRRILDLELRKWSPARTQSNLMNLNHYCHPHIMKTVELAHILCNKSADYTKLKATFTSDYEKKAWKLCQQYTINQKGNFYLNQSTVVYQAFLDKLPSAFGKDPLFYRNWHIRNQNYFSPLKMIDIVHQYFKTTPKNTAQKHLILANLYEIIRDYPRAIEQWDKVIEHTAREEPAKSNALKLTRVEALYHLKNAKVALKELDNIQPIDLANQEKKRALTKSLQERITDNNQGIPDQ